MSAQKQQNVYVAGNRRTRTVHNIGQIPSEFFPGETFTAGTVQVDNKTVHVMQDEDGEWVQYK